MAHLHSKQAVALGLMARRRRGRRTSHHGYNEARWTCGACKRRFRTEESYEPPTDKLMEVMELFVALVFPKSESGMVCHACGEWIAERFGETFTRAAVQLLTEVREVRKLERLTKGDA